eukprot:jgi/Ulvmu1/11565/UM079_0008.1
MVSTVPGTLLTHASASARVSSVVSCAATASWPSMACRHCTQVWVARYKFCCSLPFQLYVRHAPRVGACMRRQCHDSSFNHRATAEATSKLLDADQRHRMAV